MKKSKARFILEASLTLMAFCTYFYYAFTWYIQHLKNSGSKSIILKIVSDIDNSFFLNTIITFGFSFSIYVVVKIILWIATSRELLSEKQSITIQEYAAVVSTVTFIMLFLAIVLSEAQFAFLTAYISFFVLVINFFNSKQ